MWASGTIIVSPQQSGTVHQRSSSGGAKHPLRHLVFYWARAKKRTVFKEEKRSAVDLLVIVRGGGRGATHNEFFFSKIAAESLGISRWSLACLWGMHCATFGIKIFVLVRPCYRAIKGKTPTKVSLKSLFVAIAMKTLCVIWVRRWPHDLLYYILTFWMSSEVTDPG